MASTAADETLPTPYSVVELEGLWAKGGVTLDVPAHVTKAETEAALDYTAMVFIKALEMLDWRNKQLQLSLPTGGDSHPPAAAGGAAAGAERMLRYPIVPGLLESGKRLLTAGGSKALLSGLLADDRKKPGAAFVNPVRNIVSTPGVGAAAGTAAASAAAWSPPLRSLISFVTKTVGGYSLIYFASLPAYQKGSAGNGTSSLQTGQYTTLMSILSTLPDVRSPVDGSQRFPLAEVVVINPQSIAASVPEMIRDVARHRGAELRWQVLNDSQLLAPVVEQKDYPTFDVLSREEALRIQRERSYGSSHSLVPFVKLAHSHAMFQYPGLPPGTVLRIYDPPNALGSGIPNVVRYCQLV